MKTKHLEYRGVVIPVMKYLKTIPNSKFINVHGSVYSERGTPDIIGSVDGHTVVMECKRGDDENPELIQKWRLSEWELSGAIVGVVRSVKDAKELINQHKNKRGW